jgi:benzoyl-CoA reductase/2-hydroxyglutaryl-CoA dehydratase subunit BcrC/BadD/HgdB
MSTGTTAIAALTDAFEAAFTTLGHEPARDRQVVVLSWPSVPVEIVRAAGLRPVVARRAAAETPAADAHLEGDVFPARIRHLVDAALGGRLGDVACIVLPRTSDPDYKGFLYLRELVRRRVATRLPQTILFDLLQSGGPDVPAYDAGRARALFETLALMGGGRPTVDDLRQEIDRGNAARAAARRLIALRRGTPRVAGAEVIPLLGAFWQMSADAYAARAAEAADSIGSRQPLTGPRLLLTGAPVDSLELHAAIESRGAVVVAEAGPWGTGVAGDDVVADLDPFTALTNKYRADTLGPRMPADRLRDWTGRTLDDIDGVIVSLPPDDAVFGWDYPALRARLKRRGIPHTCLRSAQSGPFLPEDLARIDLLVAAAAHCREAHCG